MARRLACPPSRINSFAALRVEGDEMVGQAGPFDLFDRHSTAPWANTPSPRPISDWMRFCVAQSIAQRGIAATKKAAEKRAFLLQNGVCTHPCSKGERHETLARFVVKFTSSIVAVLSCFRPRKLCVSHRPVPARTSGAQNLIRDQGISEGLVGILEWLAQQMVQKKLGFVQQHNAFTQLDDPAQAQRLANFAWLN